MKAFLIAALLGAATLAQAQTGMVATTPATTTTTTPLTPVGAWKTIDDDGKTEKSMVRITERAGVLTGHIERLLAPGANREATCDLCNDERKNMPLMGLTILRDIRRNADDPTLWEGGDILDPKNGKTYKVRLRPVDGGRKLDVRGYIGMPMLGRTQTWIRVE
ncbi:DUF2147 domain-containing protein [Leptothrix ochracea]|uniref:DUF2147 domain-containing protein n=1 Tax=Leptothrix ochracea TaxID=735331 RepID=UPI0034E24D4F